MDSIKRPPTDYELFSAKCRIEIQKENPKMTVQEVTSELERRWKTLTKGQGFIKRPPNEYMLFSAKYRIQIKNERPGMAEKEISQELGRRWKNISAEEKAPFVAEAQILRDKAKEEHPNYRFYNRRTLERRKLGDFAKRAKKPSKKKKLEQICQDSSQIPQNQTTQLETDMATASQTASYTSGYVTESNQKPAKEHWKKKKSVHFSMGPPQQMNHTSALKNTSTGKAQLETHAGTSSQTIGYTPGCVGSNQSNWSAPHGSANQAQLETHMGTSSQTADNTPGYIAGSNQFDWTDPHYSANQTVHTTHMGQTSQKMGYNAEYGTRNNQFHWSARLHSQNRSHNYYAANNGYYAANNSYHMPSQHHPVYQTTDRRLMRPTPQTMDNNVGHYAENYNFYWPAQHQAAYQNTYRMNKRPTPQIMDNNAGYYGGKYNHHMRSQHHSAYQVPNTTAQDPCSNPSLYSDYNNSYYLQQQYQYQCHEMMKIDQAQKELRYNSIGRSGYGSYKELVMKMSSSSSSETTSMRHFEIKYYEDVKRQREKFEALYSQPNYRNTKRTCLAAAFPDPVIANTINQAPTTSAEHVNLAALASTQQNSGKPLKQLKLLSQNLMEFPNIDQHINQEAAPSTAQKTTEITENSESDASAEMISHNDISDQLQMSSVPQLNYNQVVRDLRRPGLITIPKKLRHTMASILNAYPDKMELYHDYKEDNNMFYIFKPHQECLKLLNHVELQVKNIKTLSEGNYLDDYVIEFMLNTFVEEYLFKVEDKAERLKVIQKLHIYDTVFFENLIKCTETYRKRGVLERRESSLLRKFSDVDNADKARIRRILEDKNRQVRSFNLFNKDLVIMPVFDDKHWFLVVLVNLQGCYKNREDETKKKCTILLLDPMGTLNSQRMKNFKEVMKTFLKTWYKKTKSEKGKVFGLTGEFVEDQLQFGTIKNLPMQDNLYDCGAFVVHYLEGIFRWNGGFSNIEDHLNIDWSTWHPDANKSADITRDKMMGTIVNAVSRHPEPHQSRQDLSRWGRDLGFKADGFPKRRSQSAENRPKPRHEDFSKRRYTFDGEDFLTMFRSPREFYDNPTARMAREKRCPEAGYLYLCH